MKFNIAVKDPLITFPKIELQDESYTLTISLNKLVGITANTYVGFLRAVETLSQLLSQSLLDACELAFLPITITDEPKFAYRAVMIDTARNYLKKSSILRTLDSMMYNKLNVLHWHITDDESFPIELVSVQEITNAGSYGKNYRYSVSDVKEIVTYANSNGIRVIPEVTKHPLLNCSTSHLFSSLGGLSWAHQILGQKLEV